MESTYPETADIDTSSDPYARRFAGPTGQWMLDVQKTIAMALLPADTDLGVLDVGGGHGQLAVPLCEAGYRVTVLGSAESCRHRVAGIVADGRCRFVVGNAIDLPFESASFETVLSFRMLTHCKAWPKLVSELCRVARSSVIVDYPTSQSLNRVAPALFDAKKNLEGDLTRKWRLFRHEEVTDAFAANGFRLKRREAQFFLPMVLHRMLKCRSVSVALERACRALGLTQRWGSPVIAQFVKEERGSRTPVRPSVA
jgi:2-polyprenyl-3-methyl-5-hydroxy-6-metoxy-1,4-benzoquinol methylase